MKDDRQNSLISVYIPCFNEEENILRCLESVSGQSYENLEILVIDNDSTDDSVKIAETFGQKDRRVRVISCHTRGLAAVRNEAIGHLNGEYIAAVDADDTVTTDYIEKMYLKALAEDADLVMCAHTRVNKGRKVTVHIPSCVLDRKKDIHSFFLNEGKRLNHIWGKLYKRSLFAGIHFAEGKDYEDMAIMPHILEKTGRVALIDEALYEYHFRRSSITGRDFDPKDLEGITTRLELCDFYKSLYPELEKASYDCVLVFSFYVLGRIGRSGYSRNEKSAKEVRDIIKAAFEKAAFNDKRIKAAAELSKTAPRIAAHLFSLMLT